MALLDHVLQASEGCDVDFMQGCTPVRGEDSAGPSPGCWSGDRAPAPGPRAPRRPLCTALSSHAPALVEPGGPYLASAAPADPVAEAHHPASPRRDADHDRVAVVSAVPGAASQQHIDAAEQATCP